MEKYPKKRTFVRGKLKKFLDEKGVTKQFIENCKNQEKKYNNNYTTRDCKNFVDSFYWRNTPEGFKFWVKLQNEYEDLNDKI